MLIELASCLLAAQLLPVTTPVRDNCRVWPDHHGSRAVLTCSEREGFSVAVFNAGMIVTPQGVSNAVYHDIVALNAVEWAPSDEFASVTVTFEDEPGVLLVDLRGPAHVTFLDERLSRLGISAADAHWDSTSKSLIFRTSGSGQRENEGIYSLDTRGMTLYRLLRLIPQGLALSAGRAFVIRSRTTDVTRSELEIFDVEMLLAKRRKVF